MQLVNPHLPLLILSLLVIDLLSMPQFSRLPHFNRLSLPCLCPFLPFPVFLFRSLFFNLDCQIAKGYGKKGKVLRARQYDRLDESYSITAVHTADINH
jgi:hypothetical protein